MENIKNCETITKLDARGIKKALMEFADFDIWREDESEYDDFRQVKAISEKDLLLRSDEDFWCIGKSIEKAELHQIDPVSFITKTIQQLQPLYDRCHQ